ncbi:MAG: hypothetical protein DSY80_02570 [Desulfocapsa sp.]|nr:MAG: hypothetical protein DSY80_02570 [Desulfocapsa sp.]
MNSYIELGPRGGTRKKYKVVFSGYLPRQLSRATLWFTTTGKTKMFSAPKQRVWRGKLKLYGDDRYDAGTLDDLRDIFGGECDFQTHDGEVVPVYWVTEKAEIPVEPMMNYLLVPFEFVEILE